MKKSLSILLVLSLLVVSMASVMVFAESDSDVVLISENTEADKVADSAADEEADKTADSAADEEADKTADSAAVEEADKTADSAADEEADKAADSAADEEADKAADSAADEEADKAVDSAADEETEEISFADVDETDWAYDSIKYLSNKGIIAGNESNMLYPDNGITREEVIKIVLEARKVEIAADATIEASDADSVSEWAKGYVATAIKEGILKGYEDGTIQGNKVITRAEFAVILMRSIGATADFASAGFTDVDSEWYAAEAECARNLGIITGYEDGSFRGNNAVTRREAFVMAQRIISLVEALENN